MQSTYLTLPAGKNATADLCPCGCAECTGSCCALECLERPRFFCGQLLTDQDLTALLDWARNKFRLGRFRHGWGVVCGLDATPDLGPPDRQPSRYTSRITVGPGYAVSCCGDDIVLCDPLTIDLGPAFESGKNRCEDPRLPTTDSKLENTLDLGGLKLKSNEVRVVDLYLRHHEKLIGPQPVLAGACGQAGGCEYTRAREDAQVDWQCIAVPPTTDTRQDDASRWQDQFLASMKLIDESAGKPAQWLRDQLDAQPLRHFRFARQLADTEMLERPENRAALLFWLVQERRISMVLGESCYECADDHGIPLGRVWLRAWDDTTYRRVVDILHIDTTTPYRRRLTTEQRLPAPLGAINLAQFIWQRPETAYAAFAGWGIRARKQLWEISDTWSLRDGLGDIVFVEYGSDVVMYVFIDSGLGEHIIGFR